MSQAKQLVEAKFSVRECHGDHGESMIDGDLMTIIERKTSVRACTLNSQG